MYLSSYLSLYMLCVQVSTNRVGPEEGANWRAEVVW